MGKNLDWSNLGFGYMKTDYRYVSNFKDGAWDEGAMITDEQEAIDRVIRMVKEKKVTAVTGRDISIQADSVCVHGDGVKALAFVEKIRAALQKEEIQICSLDEIV